MSGDIDNIRRFRDKLGQEAGINWDKAKHGWARYYDDGLVTLDPKVFFRYQKKVKQDCTNCHKEKHWCNKEVKKNEQIS